MDNKKKKINFVSYSCFESIIIGDGFFQIKWRCLWFLAFSPFFCFFGTIIYNLSAIFLFEHRIFFYCHMQVKVSLFFDISILGFDSQKFVYWFFSLVLFFFFNIIFSLLFHLIFYYFFSTILVIILYFFCIILISLYYFCYFIYFVILFYLFCYYYFYFFFQNFANKIKKKEKKTFSKQFFELWI